MKFMKRLILLFALLLPFLACSLSWPVKGSPESVSIM